MKTNFAIMLFLSFSFAKINFSYNGEFVQFYSQRTSNNEVLNIPFNMIDFHTSIQMEKFGIKSYITSEYHQTYDNYLHPKNITHNIRELYGTFYLDFGEISIGKKIFTLGSVDENSPIDHYNPYNYYYLLSGGMDKKVGTNSIFFEFYLDSDYMISGAISPEHNTNYYPQNDPEYNLSLPINPEYYQFLDNKGSSHESFLSIKKSNLNNEFTFTYLRAFDRVFSLSGFTIHEFDGNNTFNNPDTWFSYYLTESLNLGSVFLFNDFTIRSDVTFFHSFDRYTRNDYLNLRHSIDIQLGPNSNFYNELYDQLDIDGDGENDLFNAALQENVKYRQITLQGELPLPNNWQFNMQYFKYDLLDYSINDYTFSDTSVQLPLVTIDLNDVISDDGEYFIPGLGSSMATLTNESILIGIEKYVFDNNLKLSFTQFRDLDTGDGKLYSFEAKYDISDNINIIFGSTEIIGDESIQSENELDPGYTFNIMKDFSHNRLQLSYFF